jgi:hypothetical protein
LFFRSLAKKLGDGFGAILSAGADGAIGMRHGIAMAAELNPGGSFIFAVTSSHNRGCEGCSTALGNFSSIVTPLNALSPQ